MQMPDAEYELKNKHFKSGPFLFAIELYKGLGLEHHGKDRHRLQYCQICKYGLYWNIKI